MAEKTKATTTKQATTKAKEIKMEENSTLKNLKEENKNLKSKLSEIEEMLKLLTQNQLKQASVPDYIIKTESEDDKKLQSTDYIKVMSLNFGKLVLTTEQKGQGKIYIFNKFGETKNILYSDLANLIHNQQSFAEQGRFYIFNKQVIRNHGLDQYYEKFMTKEKIENILQYNRDEIIDLFTNATESQKETLVNILIKKMIDGEDVDVNKIDIISRIYGENLYDIARDRKNSIDEE
jgi:hypothetical protein